RAAKRSRLERIVRLRPPALRMTIECCRQTRREAKAPREHPFRLKERRSRASTCEFAPVLRCTHARERFDCFERSGQYSTLYRVRSSRKRKAIWRSKPRLTRTSRRTCQL